MTIFNVLIGPLAAVWILPLLNEVLALATAVVSPRRRAASKDTSVSLLFLVPEHNEAVVIIDADTVADAGFAHALARRAPLRDKVVQAYFDMLDPHRSWLWQLG